MFTPIHRALGIEPGAITHHLIDAAVPTWLTFRVLGG